MASCGKAASPSRKVSLGVIANQNMDKISQVCLNIKMATNPRSKDRCFYRFLPIAVVCILFFLFLFSSGTLHWFCSLDPQGVCKSYKVPILISCPRGFTHPRSTICASVLQQFGTSARRPNPQQPENGSCLSYWVPKNSAG